MHAVEDNLEKKPEPDIRSFWKVEGLPRYEFSDYEITSVVSKLVHAGATRVSIERLVIDANEHIDLPPEIPAEVLVRGVVVNDAPES